MILCLASFSFIFISNLGKSGLNFEYDCEEMQRQIAAKLPESEIVKQYVDIEMTFVLQPAESKNSKPIKITKRPLLNCLDPIDPYLLDSLRDNYLIPPAPYHKQYTGINPKYFDLKKSGGLQNSQALDVIEMVYK